MIPGQPDDRSRAAPGWLFVLPWSLDIIGGVNEVVRNLAHQAQCGVDFGPSVLVADYDCKRITPIEAADRASLPAYGFCLREPATRAGHLRHHGAFVVHFLPTLWRLRAFFVRHRVRVVNIHYPGASALYFAIARRLGWIDTLILSVHGSDAEQLLHAGWIRRAFWRRTVVAADAVVACSRALATSVERSGAIERRVTVVHNGIDPRHFEDAPAAIGARAPTILCVGTLEYKKGIDLLISAFERVAATRPEATLVAVGRWSAYVPTLEAQVEALARRAPDVARRITLVNGESHDAVLRRMRSAAVCVLPSRAEAFGLVLLEAAASGAAVVASDVGGIPEIVESGVNGLLFPCEDVGALAEALGGLLDDSSLANRLAAAHRERVLGTFTWDAAWGRYAAIAGTRVAPSRSAPLVDGTAHRRGHAAGSLLPVDDDGALPGGATATGVGL